MGYKTFIAHGLGHPTENNTRLQLRLGLVLNSGYRPRPWAITTTYKLSHTVIFLCLVLLELRLLGFQVV